MNKLKKAEQPSLSVGIDIGSTTAKIVLLDANNNVKFERYERHFSQAREKVLEIVDNFMNKNKIEYEKYVYNDYNKKFHGIVDSKIPFKIYGETS